MNRRSGGAFPPSREEGSLGEHAFARETEGERERIQRERRKRAGWRGDLCCHASFFVYEMVVAFERMPRTR